MRFRLGFAPMWALPTIFTIPSQKRIMATLIILAMLIQPKKKTPTLKNYLPPKKKDNWDVLGLNKDFGNVLKLGLVQQALA